MRRVLSQQTLIRAHYQGLLWKFIFWKKNENLKEMDKCLNSYSLQTLKSEDINNLNRPMIKKKRTLEQN